MTAPMTHAEFAARPQPQASMRLPYGVDPSQFGELWLPAGPGPHPAVLMVHGGCWQASVAGLGLMNLAAQDLSRRGLAVWNIEYRRVDQPGGGYPGTFADVAAAADALSGLAAAHGLDLSHPVAVGHSAGGHLALWAAARDQLAAASPLHTPRSQPISAVVSLGGLADLEALLAPGSQGCGPEPIEQLVAGSSAADRFADTSPAALQPFAARQVSVHGDLDGIAPVAVGRAYTDKALAAGASAELRVLKGAGHFELIAPDGPAWEEIAALVVGLAHGAP